jgi:hypothetical protein
MLKKRSLYTFSKLSLGQQTGRHSSRAGTTTFGRSKNRRLEAHRIKSFTFHAVRGRAVQTRMAFEQDPAFHHQNGFRCVVAAFFTQHLFELFPGKTTGADIAIKPGGAL